MEEEEREERAIARYNRSAAHDSSLLGEESIAGLVWFGLCSDWMIVVLLLKLVQASIDAGNKNPEDMDVVERIKH